MRLSRMATSVRLSQTMAVDSKVQSLRSEGADIIDFGAGQPDFATPEWVCEAGVEAIRTGVTRYTPPHGTERLRRAVASTLGKTSGRRYDADEVLISGGAKQAVYMGLATVAGSGDEVLIPTPCWVTYPEQVRMLGAEPVFIPAGPDAGYRLSAEALERAITPRSRCLILNTPNNPTGAVYPREELEAIGRVLRSHPDVWLLTDEIYELIVYDGGEHVSPVAGDETLRERSMVVTGVSKSFAMTGWRIGVLMAPSEIIGKAKALQSHMTGNPCSISQHASVAALEGTLAETRRRTAIFEERRNLSLATLERVEGCRCFKPQGTFYLFVDVSAFLGRERAGRRFDSSFDLVDYLLDEARVAVVPGEPFEAPGHIRLSFATGTEHVARGTERMAAALEALV